MNSTYGLSLQNQGSKIQLDTFQLTDLEMEYLKIRFFNLFQFLQQNTHKRQTRFPANFNANKVLLVNHPIDKMNSIVRRSAPPPIRYVSSPTSSLSLQQQMRKQQVEQHFFPTTQTKDSRCRHHFPRFKKLINCLIPGVKYTLELLAKEVGVDTRNKKGNSAYHSLQNHLKKLSARNLIKHDKSTHLYWV